MMKKTILMAAAAAFVLTSCEKKAENVETQEPVSVVDETHDSHEMAAAESWVGTYAGTLPCADCPGIETEIMLHHDNTYMKSEKYLETEGENELKEDGTITWNADKTQFTLTPNGDKAPASFKVSEGKITLLNADGTEVTGETAETYVLVKK